MENVTEFYAHQNIFITGGTGFIGKTLVEKLLRTCEIDSICLLMRPKKGICTEERLKQLLQNPIFDVIRKTKPCVFEKIKYIHGDISKPNFGMSECDRKFIISNTNIVFHSAATINFKENLKSAITLNTIGTKTILEMCLEMEHLKSFVYVSTAYSNPEKKDVKEIVYKTSYNPLSVIRCVDMLPQNVLDLFESEVLKGYPNTYTFTKALAENLVHEFSDKIPAAIVRPSIVTGIWKDPLPGWIETFSGITALTILCGAGVVNTILCDKDCVADIIPVDVVVNTLITAAWHTIAFKSNSMRVYNCTSGASNGLTYQQYKTTLDKCLIEYPSSTHTMFYPRFVYRINELMHNLCWFWYHTVPAAMMDMLSICAGRKPMMLKRNRKARAVIDAVSFFATREWRFETSTMETLNEHLKVTREDKLFPLDVTVKNGFDWNEYIRIYYSGIRRYVFKDDPSTLPEAKSKLKRLYWFQKLAQIATVCATLKLTAITFQIILSMVSMPMVHLES